MQCAKPLVLVLVVSAINLATTVPTGTTTRSPIGDTIKQLTSQLMETNATSPDIITDTRTPPKIKQHAKKKKEPIENSHAGVAIPVDTDEIVLEETTKKLNFYKIEKPTTNSGLSTWILLSGQTTPKPSRKPVIKPNENQNTTIMVDSNKIIKPLFKKRGTTTTTPPPTTTKLTKVKASVLSGAKKVTTTPKTTTTGTTTTTTIGSTDTTTSVSTSTTMVATNSSALPAEPKEGETELSSTDKKTRRPSTTKRKKNKNRRRRPSEKSDNTKIDKPIKESKEKPIGTQLYNYISREVMPTVGVGLAGLMVAAGLASYFLYPFGAARRSYEVDRRDKDPYYYYSDEYSGGIAEEEAIGKVIAGMPSNSLYGTNFKTPTSRHSFNNNRRIIEQSTGYTVAEEEATPAAVPEHGPRSLKVRKRRNVPQNVDDGENEVDGSISTSETTTGDPVTTTDWNSTTRRPDRVKSFIDVVKELFQLKVHLGLQLLQNATQAVSKYVSHVQRRLNEHYRNSTVN